MTDLEGCHDVLQGMQCYPILRVGQEYLKLEMTLIVLKCPPFCKYIVVMLAAQFERNPVHFCQ